jgi:hypothetical protein
MDSNLQQSTRSVTQVTYSIDIWSILYDFFQQYISIHTFFAQVDEDKSQSVCMGGCLPSVCLPACPFILIYCELQNYVWRITNSSYISKWKVTLKLVELIRLFFGISHTDAYYVYVQIEVYCRPCTFNEK